MFRVKIHKYIEQIISFFYRMGIWYHEDEETIGKRTLQIFYSFYYLLFPVSFLGGTLTNDNKDDFIFNAECSLMATVILVRLLLVIWRKTEILELLNRTCSYSVKDLDQFTLVNNKLEYLMNFVVVFLSSSYFCAFSCAMVGPLLGLSERKLFFDIAFPLEWRDNDFAYWLAVLFIFTEAILAGISLLYTVTIWYLMLNCALRYEVLGKQIRNIGEITFAEGEEPRKVSNAERDRVYHQDLHEAIASHKNLKEVTNQSDSFLSELFVIQLATSGLCICGSIYNLAFSRGESLIELLIYILMLLYNIFDIFMIMYFGNEITLASDRLSYSLFESDWVHRSQPIKRVVIIFGEFLKQPQQLVVLKLYPLTLDTFTRILNSAYSTFNILKNLK